MSEADDILARQMGEEPGPHRGPPTLEERIQRENEANAQAVIDSMMDYLPTLLKWPFDRLARQRGEHWKLDDQEAVNLGIASRPVIQKYAMHWLIQWGPEAILLLALGGIIGPRLEEDKRLDKLIAEDKARKETEAANRASRGDPPKDDPPPPAKSKPAKKKAAKKKAAKKSGRRKKAA